MYLLYLTCKIIYKIYIYNLYENRINSSRKILLKKDYKVINIVKSIFRKVFVKYVQTI